MNFLNWNWKFSVEQTDNLLKELYEPLEKDKDLEHLEENSPPICLK